MLRSKRISRFFACLLSAFVLFPAFTALSADKSGRAVYAADNAITVFSVEDYIDESILESFEEETGIGVNYLTFATNEEMYNELLKDKKAVDLICPSEYMIMKMRDEGLLKKFVTPENFKKYGSDYIKTKFKEAPLEIMDEDEEETYAVGYMWGTIGLIYNMDNGVTAEDLKSWSAIWQNFTGRVTVKDSIRDTYFIALAEVYKDELLSLKNDLKAGKIDDERYNEKITEIFNRTDEKTVNDVRESILNLKSNLYGFEVDAGKSEILTGKIDVNVAWSGDAVYSISQGLYDEESGELLPENKRVKLGYAVPEEGSNVWFDGYVMTADADEESSLLFLDYICSPEIATKNMSYTGYTSCIVGDEVFEYVKDTYNDDDDYEKSVDLKYIFDPENKSGKDENYYVINVSSEAYQMFTAQYPEEDVLTRCAIMKNFSGEELLRINEMWKEIKLITFPVGTIIAILAAFAVCIALIVLFVNREKIFARVDERAEKSAKKKDKVVSRTAIK